MNTGAEALRSTYFAVVVVGAAVAGVVVVVDGGK